MPRLPLRTQDPCPERRFRVKHNGKRTILIPCVDSVKRTSHLRLIIVVYVIDVCPKWIITVRG